MSVCLSVCLSVCEQFISNNTDMFNYKCSLGANQDPGVTESLHSQRRNWVDEGEIKGKIEAAKVLQRLIEEMKKSKSYLTDEEMKAVEESFKYFQS